MKELILKTEDGIKIAANHYSNGFDHALIICPGFMMYKDTKPFLMLSDRLSKDFDVVTMDFRGHGKSKGRYTFTSKENLDLKTVVDYVRPKYKTVGVMGFSLGAAVAINETAENKAIDKLMVVSPPSEFEKIENRFFDKDNISSNIKKFEWKKISTRLGSPLLEKPKPIENVDKISPIPILFVHGDKDTVIEPHHVDLLYKKAKDPKRLVIFKDCLHAEDIFLSDSFNDFISLCIEWFKE